MTTEDTAKFSSPDSPRLIPGEAGLAALLGRSSGRCISTGLQRLDAALAPPPELYPSPLGLGLGANGPPACLDTTESSGGVRRGEVTEIIGPRGCGKTALAMSLAATALRAGRNVVWIDTSGPLCVSRLESFLQGTTPATPFEEETSSTNKGDLFRRLCHFHPPSLAHLMALISFRTSGFPPQNTGLIVVDTISQPFTEFPPRPPRHLRETLNNKQKNKLDEENVIYYKHIASLLSSLCKLALQFDCAVVAINGMGTGFRPTGQPMLRKLISGYTWDKDVSTSILLYHHWLPLALREQTGMKSVRIAEVQKTGGKALCQRKPVPFVIEETGLQHFLDEESLSIAQSTPYRAPEKRTRDGTTSSPDSHRPKLELTIEITRPNDVEDDDELLDPLPTEDFEIPDSESDFGDETLSVDSKQSFDPLDPPEEFFVNQYEDGWY